MFRIISSISVLIFILFTLVYIYVCYFINVLHRLAMYWEKIFLYRDDMMSTKILGNAHVLLSICCMVAGTSSTVEVWKVTDAMVSAMK